MEYDIYCIFYTPMRILLFIILPLYLASCMHRKPGINIVNTKAFVLVDTNGPSNAYLQEPEGDFPIYYIGRLLDTIRIGKRYGYDRSPDTFPLVEFPYSRTYSDQTLEIVVDTSFVTNRVLEYWEEDGTINADSTRNYHASVFTIKNISDSVIWMGRTFSVYFLHREFKNRQGQWVKVGNSLHTLRLCLTNEPFINLQPGEIVLSKVVHYQGNFATDCRLVFGREDKLVYSNTFRQSIDEKMLQD